MKKSIAVLVAAATLGGVSGSASAVEIRGAASCGEWVEEHGSIGKLTSDGVAMETWLVGFLSGVVMHSGDDILRGADNASLFLWMTNYCKANPLNSLGKAGGKLYLELKEMKSK